MSLHVINESIGTSFLKYLRMRWCYKNLNDFFVCEFWFAGATDKTFTQATFGSQHYFLFWRITTFGG